MATIDTRPPCKHQGCRGRAEKRGYCSEHQTETLQVENRHKFYNENRRNKEKAKVYNSWRWRKLSKMMINKYPLCIRCDAMGVVKLSELTDHLAGFTNYDDDYAWNEDYLYPICKACHRIVTPLEYKYDFSSMPLDKAVLLKYRAKIRKEKEIEL